jgi:mannose-6-phosphate isomerase-like protein (cupin superfamily)
MGEGKALGKPQHHDAQARRVVTGVDAAGRSYIESDELTPHRFVGAGTTKCDLWRFPSLPSAILPDDGIDPGRVETAPPHGGLVIRLTTFPPDDEWDRAQGYSDSTGRLSTGNPDFDDEGIPGLHVTESVDTLTIVSGELWCVLQEGEVLLRPGDTIVQRGTKHAWSNRTSDVVVALSVMVSAER